MRKDIRSMYFKAYKKINLHLRKLQVKYLNFDDN